MIGTIVGYRLKKQETRGKIRFFLENVSFLECAWFIIPTVYISLFTSQITNNDPRTIVERHQNQFKYEHKKFI